jgi:superfamily II DNA or RNA helicase
LGPPTVAGRSPPPSGRTNTGPRHSVSVAREERVPVADRPLFIVDNGVSGRNGLDYLREWSELAKSIDIATGFFEIGALLDLDGHWQKFNKIRILMGDEISHRTRKALLVAVRDRAEQRLDDSIESDKEWNAFLTGVDAVVDALGSGRIECRVYNKDKFHAKTYITHGKFDVVGSQALVGSSNFTRPGLTENVELNINIESSSEVAQLQEWYEHHWDDAVDVTPEVLRVIQRHSQPFTPFDVYAQALRSMFGELEPTASEWDQHHSRMFPRLDRYQQEAYWALTNIARQHGGAFLCDGVGLGKTYVGLMLIERLVLHENKRVVLFAPKSVKDSVWVPELRRHLAHIGGVGGSADFSNLSVFSHTDLTRALEYPQRFERITELADAVVIDEAHHFRNTGKRGDPANPFERSRYYKMYDLIGDRRHKSVFLLTATPINNSLNDFKHLVELFSRGDDAYFSRTLGVTSLAGRLNSITKTLKTRLGDDVSEAEASEEAADLLSTDDLFQGLVVQRSRAYAKASQIQETGSGAAFPTREDPKVADYSIRKSYGKLLDLVDTAFKRAKPLFALPMYYPLAYYTGPDTSIDPLEWNRQAQVVSLIRTNFLKRFESSVYAFELSCDRLLRKLLAFVEVNSESAPERKRLERWIDQHQEMLTQTRARQLSLWGEEDTEPDEENEDIVPPELLEKAAQLSREDYNVPEILAETYLDLDQIATLLDESRAFEPSHDDKLKKLVRLLRSKEMAGHKVLIFTEFADTARYIRRELEKAGIGGAAELDSGTKTNRADAIRRFSPYYNGSSSKELQEAGEEETVVLIATDVLSEGLNLQDATRLINYDIHWNPVRLMQRIGRVDRRLNPDVEARLVEDHPELAKQRGTIAFWNFLPPDDLDVLLTLYSKVSHKTLLISKTLGIEGKKLLKPEDDYAALKEFNASYEGETTVQEHLHLEYQRLLTDYPELEERLAGLPKGVFSERDQASEGSAGVFFCYRLPALDTESAEFTLEVGVTRWYLHRLPGGELFDDPKLIVASIRSEPDTVRTYSADRTLLVDVRDTVLKHIKNTYLKQLDVPIGAPKPMLVGWMELKAT